MGSAEHPSTATSRTTPAPSRSPRGARGLTTRFVLATAVTFLIMGGGLAILVAHVVERSAQDGARDAALLAASLVVDELIDDLAGDEPVINPSVHETLITATAIERLVVYGPDGVVIGSTDEGLIGRPVVDNRELDAALRGTTSTGIEDPEPGDGFAPGTGRLMEVYTPVRDGNGEIIAVFELYTDYEQAAGEARRLTIVLVAVIGVGLIFLYATLLPLVRRTSANLVERHRALQWHARHDTLTGLSNRDDFQDRLDDRLRRDTNRPVMLAMVDIAGFREVNELLGHDAADDVLVEVSRRLVGAAPPSAIVGRFGGDEFVLAVDGDTIPAPGVFARSLEEVLVEPIDAGSVDITIEVHVAVLGIHLPGTDAKDSLRRLDTILGKVKVSPAGALVDRDTTPRRIPRLTLLSEFQTALLADDLELHYQPMVSLGTGETVGAEALLRWTLRNGEPIPPDEFIPMLERTALIRPLTRWVLSRVAADQRRLHECGFDPRLCLNLSTRSLTDRRLFDDIAEFFPLHPTQDRGRPIELELTETAILRDPDTVVPLLADLRARGMSIALDDFGTGQSSLSQLRRLPLDTLKIDRAFVRDLATSRAAQVLVQAIVEVAGQLDLAVVLEGIETADELEIARSLRCEIGQGYLFAKPAPLDSLIARLEDERETAYSTKPVV
jgi:diguanylate cyclase (GGDEF)-like protein